MELKLYVMDIRELERADLSARALCLLDPVRKDKAMRVRNEKDRARLAGAGLLLLIAHAGLPGSLELTDRSFLAEKNCPEDGRTYTEKGTEIKGSRPNEYLQILSPALIIQTIISEEEKRGHPLSRGIFYEVSDRGQPAWKEAAEAAYPYFSLSHSGHYAALAAGNIPVGLDIQEPREVLHSSIGDYRKFSRMESYFKCTGRGIDLKIDACYREMEEAEKSGVYSFRSVPMPDEYALWVCVNAGGFA
ncbi:MAG: hypothetical protein LUC95_07775 [Lachnospiraceae bacterium]|nr:hypothetical protein [Lachnospiraceae bacterium]